MKRKFPLIPAVLAIGLALVAGIAARTMIRADRMEARLREVYDGAVLSALRQMEDMELNIGKALLSSGGAADAYLNRVSAGAAEVQRSLSLLPLAHTATKSAVKFANQVADYAGTLLGQDALTQADADTLTALVAACAESASALYAARDALSAAAVAGTEAFYPAGDAPSYDSAVAYPTLIYDGPFSDARETGQARGLGLEQVTREEALGIARAFVGEERVVAVSPGADMGGSIPCYGVTADLGDMTLQLAVTRQGGQVLWMAPDPADFVQEKTVAQCRDSAARFLASRGYGDMEPTYFQVYQGVAVISFAAAQGDTLLYPDLVKVQLRLDTAQVVGIEARNYLQNHGSRGSLTPDLTPDQAKSALSPRFSAEDSRLCLIPTDGGEKLCYEFRGEFDGETYLCYINARTGRQEELLRVVEGETGLQAM